MEYLKRKLTAEEINALPLYSYSGEIAVISTQAEWRAAEADILNSRVIGFDTETKPSFRKGVNNVPNLIQMAAENKVYLIQLRKFRFNSQCARLLSSPDLLKVGVGIGGDMASLGRIYPFEPGGIVDLGVLTAKYGFASHGLRTLAASIFGWRISKGPQCSNWNAAKLSQRQIVYAATDAWIGRMIYLELMAMGFAS